MFARFVIVALCTSAALAASNSSEPSLRGTASPSAETEDSLQHSECTCAEAGKCECRTSSLGSAHQVVENPEQKQAMLNKTQELQAWWEARGKRDKQMTCSCALGSSACQCDHTSTELQSLVQSPMLNETEKTLSLWWQGGGYHAGGWHAGGHPHGWHAGGWHSGGRHGGGWPAPGARCGRTESQARPRTAGGRQS